MDKVNKNMENLEIKIEIGTKYRSQISTIAFIINNAMKEYGFNVHCSYKNKLNNDLKEKANKMIENNNYSVEIDENYYYGIDKKENK